MKKFLLKIWRFIKPEYWVHVGDGIEIELSQIKGPIPFHFAMRQIGSDSMTHCILNETGLHNTFGSLPANDRFVKLCLGAIWDRTGQGARP